MANYLKINGKKASIDINKFLSMKHVLFSIIDGIRDIILLVIDHMY